MGSRTPYPDEFRHEAVRLVTDQGMPPSQIARDLGIDPKTLRRWLRAKAPAADASTEPLAPAAELARLRRENEQLRMAYGLGLMHLVPKLQVQAPSATPCCPRARVSAVLQQRSPDCSRKLQLGWFSCI